MDDQVHRQGSQARSIPHWRLHLLGKRGSRLSVTVRATFAFGLVLGNVKPCWGHISHLSVFDCPCGYGSQICLAVRVDLDRMHDDLVGNCPERRVMSIVTCLSSRFFPTAFALAAGLLLTGKPIQRGQQVALVAVFGQPLAQGLDLLAQLPNRFFKQRNTLHVLTQLGIFLPQPDQFVFCCHARTLRSSSPFGKVLGLLSGPE
jgi:hypothetical protein